MLAVAAVELGDPVSFIVGMKTYDVPLHPAFQPFL